MGIFCPSEFRQWHVPAYVRQSAATRKRRHKIYPKAAMMVWTPTTITRIMHVTRKNIIYIYKRKQQITCLVKKKSKINGGKMANDRDEHVTIFPAVCYVSRLPFSTWNGDRRGTLVLVYKKVSKTLSFWCISNRLLRDNTVMFLVLETVPDVELKTI